MPSTIKTLMTAGALTLGLAAPALLPDSSPASAAVPAADLAGRSGGSHSGSHSGSKAAPAVSPLGYDLQLVSFNILASTMAPGGKSRAQRAARWVQNEHAAAVSFQEVAADQLPVLRHAMPGFGFWPRRTLGTHGSAVQIAWRTKRIKLVRTGYEMGPFLGIERPIPYAKLRDRRTGRTFWVMAIHNSPAGNEGERNAETSREIARLKKMIHTGDPVFALGDVNERSEFCTDVARATPMRSLNGGTEPRPCPVPRRGGPDWMMGARGQASGFAKVDNHISDHPALTVHVHVPPLKR